MPSPLRFVALFTFGISLFGCASTDGSSDAVSGEGGTGNEGGTGGSSAAGSGGTGGDGVGGGGTGGGTADVCPPARPSEGNACQIGASVCSYDEIECRCQDGVWSCEEPVHPGCPASPPAQDSMCDLPDMTECDFLQQECECLEGRWDCQSENENDGGIPSDSDAGPGTGDDPAVDQRCPQARPAETTACEPSDVMCTYESTECVCPDGMWSCNEPVDMGCPDSPPLHGSACVGLADCDFVEVECECLGGSWNCKTND